MMNRIGLSIIPKNDLARKFIDKCQQPEVSRPRTYVIDGLFWERSVSGTKFLGTPQDVINQIIARRGT